MRLPATVLLVIAGIAGCGDVEQYNFRSEKRPAYSKRMTVAELARTENVTLLDVRLQEDFKADAQLIPGASYRNPEDIVAWSGDLPAHSRVVVYCVHGQWVSQKVATFLAARGHDVYALEGGIDAWRTANKASETTE